jgi:hypothetical protein
MGLKLVAGNKFSKYSIQIAAQAGPKVKVVATIEDALEKPSN